MSVLIVLALTLSSCENENGPGNPGLETEYPVAGHPGAQLLYDDFKSFYYKDIDKSKIFASLYIVAMPNYQRYTLYSIVDGLRSELSLGRAEFNGVEFRENNYFSIYSAQLSGGLLNPGGPDFFPGADNTFKIEANENFGGIDGVYKALPYPVPLNLSEGDTLSRSEDFILKWESDADFVTVSFSGKQVGAPAGGDVTYQLFTENKGGIIFPKDFFRDFIPGECSIRIEAATITFFETPDGAIAEVDERSEVYLPVLLR